jgi:hypothetical protein
MVTLAPSPSSSLRRGNNPQDSSAKSLTRPHTTEGISSETTRRETDPSSKVEKAPPGSQAGKPESTLKTREEKDPISASGFTVAESNDIGDISFDALDPCGSMTGVLVPVSLAHSL